MQRGSLIIYDNNGRIWFNSGDAEGDVLPHEYPTGLPYIEAKFGELSNKRVLGVDMTTKTLITEELPKPQPTYEELQQQLLAAQGVI